MEWSKWKARISGFLGVRQNPLGLPGVSSKGGAAEDLFRRWAMWCGAIAAGFGGLGLASWLINWPALSSFSPQYIPMAPTLAAGFVLLGLAIWLHARWQSSRPAGLWIATFAILAGVLGVASLGIRLLSADPSSAIFRPPAQFVDPAVNRVSRFAAVGFILAAGAVLGLGPWRRRLEQAASWLGVVLAGGGFLIVLAYGYQAPLLYGGPLRPLSLSTGMAFMAIGAGLVASVGPRLLPQRIIVGPSVRAQLLRWLLPITFFTVLLDEVLSDAFRWYSSANPALQALLQTLLSASVVTLIITQAARRIGGRLDRAETARSVAQEQLRRARDSLEEQVKERTAQLAIANEELRKQHTTLSMALQAAGMVTWEWDVPAGTIHYSANTAWMAQGDASAPCCTVDDLLQEVHPEDRTGLVRAIQRTKSENCPFEYEYRVRMPDGVHRWILGKGAAVSVAEGKPLQVLGTSQDITARKQSEELLTGSVQALRDNMRFLQTLMDAIPSPVFYKDTSGRYLGCNNAFQQYLGLSSEQIIGKTVHDVAPRDLAERYHQADRELLEKPGVQTYESSVLYADGSRHEVIFNKATFRNAEGKVAGLIGTITDVTERRRVEEHVRLLADAVQSTAELICITDAEDRFIFVNRAFQQAYGYSQGEILGKSPELLMSPKNRESLLTEILEQTRLGGWQGEVLDRRKDGSEFPVLLSTSQIKDPAGRVLGLMGVAQDITVRKRVEKRTAAFSLLGYQLSAATTPEQAANIILEIASDLLGWEAAYLHLYSQAEDRIIPILTIDTVGGRRTPIDEGRFTLDPSPLMREVMREGARLIDRAKESSLAAKLVPFGDTKRLSASMMYVPVQSGGTVVGLLSIQSYTPRRYTQEDLSLLQALADRCGDALERIRVAEALRQAEAKYRSIFENATEGIFQTTPKGRYLSANMALARMFGYESPGELIAGLTDIGHQSYVRPEQRDQLNRLLESGVSVQGFETERYRKDGSRFWMSISARAVRDGTGTIVYYEGTNQDITARKQAEVVLGESEAKFRTLFESAPIAIALQSADGKILQTNKAYQRMLDYTNDELRRLGVRRITHPDDVAEGRRLFAELVEGKRDRYEREKRYLRKDGRVVWGQSSASALHDARGNLQFIISMVEDITERRAIVEALRESERNLRLIAENTTDVIFAFDMNRQPIYINPAVEELTGYTFAEIRAKKFVNWIHPDDQKRMLEHWEELYAGKGYSEVEFRLITKGGETKWCSSTWGPILDENGRQIGVQGRERDITERKQMEREVLEISAKERRRLGHELHDGLGQYLAGIALKAKLLEETLSAEGLAQTLKAKEVVELVNTALRRSRGLAHGFDPVLVEAQGLVAALGNLAAQTRDLYGLHCVFACRQEQLPVNAETSLALYRITQEAIHNAHTHGRARHVKATLELDETQLCLRIRDDGQGAPPQPQPHSGMGWRIMHYRANSIGGHLTINSSLGQGTEIVCRVPRKLCLEEEETKVSRRC